jgi:hypothetical protein
MRCEHEHDDGAYVLGALSPAERAAYERHLATCSFCREAVAEIAVLPGLLGRLDPADFAKLLDPTLSSPPPPRRAPHPVAPAHTTARRRKTRRVRVLSTALAAAVVGLVVGIGAVFVTGDRGTGVNATSTATVAMTAVDSSVPVSAEINLVGANGGTKINLICIYNKTSASLKPYTVRLMAYGPDDAEEQLGSWIAAPGKEFTMSGVTHFTQGNLSRLELVRNDGNALLAYDVP